LRTLPHVGRSAELAAFAEWTAEVASGHGGVHIVAGPSGIGKTRLVDVVAERAAKEHWTVATGRVYSIETGVPYAVWSDALLNLLRGMDANARQVLTRGGSWLGTICPAFATETAVADPEQRDGKAKLLWNCAQLLMRVAEKQPLLLVLENLHQADGASLELLHFVARQLGRSRVGIIGTYAETEVDRSPGLREMEQSLLALGSAKLMRLEALSQEEVEQLLTEAFSTDHAAARKLAGRLYSWTRGHPFFVEEALKALVSSGRLHERDGQWLGWDVEELDLPKSVQSSVSRRLDSLSEGTRTVAGIAAVIGAHVRLGVLRDASELSNDTVLAALDELVRAGILVESRALDAGDYQFSHPIIQDVLYVALGAARARVLHTKVARVLEATVAGGATSHADVLAFHFARAEPDAVGAKAGRYLAAAGRDALARHADRAAVDYLSAALERSTTSLDVDALMEDLAQARQRLGDYVGAMELWEKARLQSEERGNLVRCARVERRMGLACYWTGRFEEALGHFDAALVAAARADAALVPSPRATPSTGTSTLH
jgi:predicted ATPase